MTKNDAAVKRTKVRVLIVDDDPGQRSLLESFLSGQGFQIIMASSGEMAIEMLASEEIDIMISDVRMPGISGLEVMRQSRLTYPTLPILLVTAYADIRDAVTVMRDGAVNYLEKPIDLDELLASVDKSVGIEGQNKIIFPDEMVLPDDVIAESPAMRDVFREAALVAPSESRILITGESGVGKEVLTDVIHAWSTRSKKSLIKVNCAAIPENLLESELFGHEKGSFTGASAQRIGRFEEASEGSILLDEIAEMSPALQAKLLRITQEGSFQRVGSNTDRHTNARILASTNRNLEQEVEKGEFREDLFFRLNVMELYIPPLRERREDILLLAAMFAEEFSKGKPRFSASVSRCLLDYQWPGNIRELRNAMERSALMARGEVIISEHLPRRIQQSLISESTELNGSSPGKRMEEIERDAILASLGENKFNRTETARMLGISRRALTYKLQNYSRQGYAIDPE